MGSQKATTTTAAWYLSEVPPNTTQEGSYAAAAAAVVSNRETAYSSYYSELLKTKVHASYAPARCVEGHPVSPWLKDESEEGGRRGGGRS
mmetsp:Transcript_7484/g.19516  ORF Transcript_7484/g.19516 Transcript_7484/m.19516 type:complete len:90 (-) Transcript_7484:73-342(-)